METGCNSRAVLLQLSTDIDCIVIRLDLLKNRRNLRQALEVRSIHSFGYSSWIFCVIITECDYFFSSIFYSRSIIKQEGILMNPEIFKCGVEVTKDCLNLYKDLGLRTRRGYELSLNSVNILNF